jgi:hypothetical protein
VGVSEVEEVEAEDAAAVEKDHAGLLDSDMFLQAYVFVRAKSLLLLF